MNASDKSIAAVGKLEKFTRTSKRFPILLESKLYDFKVANAIYNKLVSFDDCLMFCYKFDSLA